MERIHLAFTLYDVDESGALQVSELENFVSDLLDLDHLSPGHEERAGEGFSKLVRRATKKEQAPSSQGARKGSLWRQVSRKHDLLKTLLLTQLKMMDADGDGVLSYTEWIHAIISHPALLRRFQQFELPAGGQPPPPRPGPPPCEWLRRCLPCTP